MSIEPLAPRKAPVQARSARRVEKIVDAARQLLIESGHQSITARNIAAKAGVPIASFYQYFPNKESVINHLYQIWLDETHDVYDANERRMQDGAPWPELIRNLRLSQEQGMDRWRLELELQRAMDANPALCEVRRDAMLVVARRLAKVFRHYGSQWDDDELVNMGGIIIDMNREIQERMDRQAEDPPMGRHTQRIVMYGLYCMIERCLRGDHKIDLSWQTS